MEKMVLLELHSETGQSSSPGSFIHPARVKAVGFHDGETTGLSVFHKPLSFPAGPLVHQADKPQRCCQGPRRWRSQRRRQPACSRGPQQGPCHNRGSLDSVVKKGRDEGFLLLHKALCWFCISWSPISPEINLPILPKFLFF